MKQQGHSSDIRFDHNKFLINAGLLCGVAMFFYACSNDIEKIKAFSPSESLPVVQAEDFETVFSDSGLVRFYLKTPELKRFETDGQSYTEFPKGVLLMKYDLHGQIISSISSRYARQYTKEKKWEAKNDVVAINNEGDTLRTETLTWDEQAGRIYSDGFVRIIRSNQNLTGFGFESDQSLKNWRIKKPKGPIYIQLRQEGTSPEDSVFGNAPYLQPVNTGKN
jgi:LPS export ABC transporter protein LptC